MPGKGIGALVLAPLAAVSQMWIGWVMSLFICTLVWIVLFGGEPIARTVRRLQAPRVRAGRVGCPYCAWSESHSKGAGCAS